VNEDPEKSVPGAETPKLPEDPDNIPDDEDDDDEDPGPDVGGSD